jgi:competence protein ComEA
MKKLLAGALLLLSTSFVFAAVNLNTATQAQLEAINGIGPKKAQAIIEYRTKNGGFKKVDDLQNVSGIGHGKTFEKLKGEFSVSGGQSTNKASLGSLINKNNKVTPTAQQAVKNAPKGFNNPLQSSANKPANAPIPATPAVK